MKKYVRYGACILLFATSCINHSVPAPFTIDMTIHGVHIFNTTQKNVRISLVYTNECKDSLSSADVSAQDPLVFIAIKPQSSMTFKSIRDSTKELNKKNSSAIACKTTASLSIYDENQKPVFNKIIDHDGMFHIFLDEKQNSYNIFEVMP